MKTNFVYLILSLVILLSQIVQINGSKCTPREKKTITSKSTKWVTKTIPGSTTTITPTKIKGTVTSTVIVKSTDIDLLVTTIDSTTTVISTVTGKKSETQPTQAVETNKTKDNANENKSKTQTSKQESSKTQTSKQESSKTQTSKQESSKTQTSKAESSKTQTSKAESSKSQTSKAESSKTQTSKQESSKTQTSKAESSKTQTSKAESSKSQTSKQESSKTQTSSSESAKSQTPDPTQAPDPTQTSSSEPAKSQTPDPTQTPAKTQNNGVTPSKKRGVAWGLEIHVTSTPLRDSGSIGWWYNWAHYDVGTGLSGNNYEFVPMLKDMNSVEAFQQAVATQTPAYALGYNEPDFSGQDIGELASIWNNVMEPLKQKGTKLGSPSPATNVVDYLKSFKQACNCEWDFSALHVYDQSLDPLKKLVNDLYDTFNKPVWITEIACVEGWPENSSQPTTCDQSKTETFMKDLINYCENEPKVAAYSWEGFNVGENNKLINEQSGELTQLGQIYLNGG